jgi:hypothetical protein
MQARHEQERVAAREYIRRLKHDNEVILVQEMARAGLIW